MECPTDGNLIQKLHEEDVELMNLGGRQWLVKTEVEGICPECGNLYKYEIEWVEGDQ